MTARIALVDLAALPTLRPTRGGVILNVIEAITPVSLNVIKSITSVIGRALGAMAAQFARDREHWIAFSMFSILGTMMIRNGLGADQEEAAPVGRHSFWLLAVTALALGLATMLMATLGVMIGRPVGNVAGQRAEARGGLALIGIGGAVLHEPLKT